MSSIITLDSDARAVLQQGFDDLITVFGKNCKLVYPPNWEYCSDCIWDQIGQKSSNRWRTGGPLPFSDGQICPMCNGIGRRAVETQTETIKMTCAFLPKDFYFPMNDIDLRVPYGIIQTRFYLTDLPKIERCDHVLFQVDIQGVARRPYKLHQEPSDSFSIIQNRYAVCAWKRSG